MSNKIKGVDLEAIKRKLIDRKNELQLELVELNVSEGGDSVLDSGDQAQSVSRETLRRSIQNAEADEYNRIIQALKMIDEGTYGICVDCGQPISEKRLKHFANATRCLVCQEQFEELKPR